MFAAYVFDTNLKCCWTSYYCVYFSITYRIVHCCWTLSTASPLTFGLFHFLLSRGETSYQLCKGGLQGSKTQLRQPEQSNMIQNHQHHLCTLQPTTNIPFVHVWSLYTVRVASIHHFQWLLKRWRGASWSLPKVSFWLLKRFLIRGECRPKARETLRERQCLRAMREKIRLL